ncbi:hypothetical protein GCM10028793_10180 [Nocardiopsis oceani]
MSSRSSAASGAIVFVAVVAEAGDASIRHSVVHGSALPDAPPPTVATRGHGRGASVEYALGPGHTEGPGTRSGALSGVERTLSC